MAPIVVIAGDKWRGTFTSQEASEALAAGVRRALPAAEVRVVPLADGGEGTLAVLQAAWGGERRRAPVHGPLGEPAEAPWLLVGRRAVVEAAAAVGLAGIAPARRDPLAASSRGVGQLVAAALDAGCDEIVLALGGTATMDGGAGMATALGFALLGGGGEPLGPGGGPLAQLARIDPAGADPRLAGIAVEAWCDVVSLLLGERGAAAVYGPQKGADPAAIARLEEGLGRLAGRFSRDLGREVAELPGAGAAGGLGAGAAAFLGARLVSGAGRILDAVGFDAALEGAGLVITGEGSYDPDAMPGKLPDAVLARAAARDIPAWVICGDLAGEAPAAVRVLSRGDLAAPHGGNLSASDLAELGERAAASR